MVATQFLTIPQHISRAQITRLFSKVVVDRETGCWNWTAGVTPSGYGKVTWRSDLTTAHRVMYAWLVGPLPNGYGRDVPVLDHAVCSNRRCCNPAHLRLVSTRDNLMRGDGPPALNARKTHCKRGHSLDGAPLNAKGSRVCQECRRMHARAAYTRAISRPDADAVKRRWIENQRRRMHGPRREELLAAKRAHYHATKMLKRHAVAPPQTPDPDPPATQGRG